MKRLLAVHFSLTLLLCACATNDAALQAATAVAQVETATIPSFVAWDRQHQMDIVAKHKGDVAGGQAELADYRKKRDAIVATLTLLEKSAADGKIADVHALFAQLWSLLHAIGYTPGGL